jgi:hypothetical protein
MRCSECKREIPTGDVKLQVIGSMGGRATAPNMGVLVILCGDDVTLPKYSDTQASRRDWSSVYQIGA